MVQRKIHPDDKRKFNLDVDEVRSNPIYHGVYFGVSHPEGGPMTPSEFLQAPMLHVGTREQALQIVNPVDSHMDEHRVWNPNARAQGVHKLNFSQFAEFHPHIVSDKVVNAIHSKKLGELGLQPTSGVGGSGEFKRGKLPAEKMHYEMALEALNQNKVIPYWNEFEIPHDRQGKPRTDAPLGERVSFLVPSPILNLRQAGNRRDPLIQPTLPMDFIGSVSESATTRAMRAQGGEAFR